MPILTARFYDDSGAQLSGVHLLVEEKPELESPWTTLFDGFLSGYSQQVTFTSNYLVRYGRSYKNGYTAYGQSSGRMGTWDITKNITLTKFPQIADMKGWNTWDWDNGFLVDVASPRYIFNDGWQWHITNDVVGWCGTPEMPDVCYVQGMYFLGQQIEYVKCRDYWLAHIHYTNLFKQFPVGTTEFDVPRFSKVWTTSVNVRNTGNRTHTFYLEQIMTDAVSGEGCGATPSTQYSSFDTKQITLEPRQDGSVAWEFNDSATGSGTYYMIVKVYSDDALSECLDGDSASFII